jgi:KaiC/GvpD/RAD55 family RecA-like ATPase
MGLKKKLQVFVSSTYTDLIKERQAAVEAILTAGHIPAGMELFSPGDKSQLEVIKRWIDESDVYLLLLGGRYGSIDPDSGKSYIQLEYEYAIHKAKPFFALVISDEHLDERVRIEGMSVIELANQKQLQEFRALVKNRLVKFWSDLKDIKLAILQKLPDFERQPELIGWVPGNEALNSNIIAAGIARLAGDDVPFRKEQLFSVSVNHALEKLDIRSQQPGLVGVPSGFSNLDRLTSGWQLGELTVLAAKPSIGKTSFVLSALRNAAVNFNLPVAIFTLEMSTGQLTDCLIASQVGINIEDVRKGNVGAHEWEKLHLGIQRFRDAPIYIDDTPSLSVYELMAKSRQLKAQYDVQVIFIDYLQLLTVDSKVETGSDNEMALITKCLKRLAKELDVSIVAVSQLGHSFEIRNRDKKPSFFELGQLGSIEENADKVFFLYRPEFYGIVEDEMGNSSFGLMEVIIVKNRSGHIDTAQLRFIGQYMKVVNWDD